MTDMSLQGCRILIVEDEYMLATDLQRELENAGAIVLGPVPSVEQAIELIDAETDVHGAMLDVNLAGQLVFPVADKLIARGVPVILTTGYDQSAIPAEYAHLPRCEKPVIVRRVAATLRNVLGR